MVGGAVEGVVGVICRGLVGDWVDTGVGRVSGLCGYSAGRAVSGVNKVR